MTRQFPLSLRLASASWCWPVPADRRGFHPRSYLAGAVSSLSLLLGGCVGFSPDGGISAVRDAVGPTVGRNVHKISSDADAELAHDRVERLLKAPLSADKAVAVALLNNRGLQAAYSELGISEAQYVQASLPPNPTFSLTEFGGRADLEIEQQLVVNVLALATLSARTEITADLFRAARFRAAEATLRLAAETRRQFYRVVAANEAGTFLKQAHLSAEAASDIAKQLGETGAANKLDQAREHALYAEVGAQGARAALQQRAEREQLIRLLGLWGRNINFVLPSKLPPLPRVLRGARQIEAQALRRRVDLLLARAELDALAKTLGLVQATRFVNLFELGGVADYQEMKSTRVSKQGRIETERDKSFGTGVATTIEIPIFDFGQARVARAEQTYMQASNLLAQRAVNIRSQVRQSYQAYRATHDLVMLYNAQILPLRNIIQELSLKQYSGMLTDVSQLILDARARVLSNVQAIEARRDFWIANVDLNSALIGGVTGDTGGPRTDVASGAASTPGSAERSAAGGEPGGTGAGAASQ